MDKHPTLTLIEHGTVYAPDARGDNDVLLANESVLKVGRVAGKALAKAGLEVEVVDASGCIVVPGFVDPHSHLLGAGGEQGYASRMPEVTFDQLVRAGITTVVGLLGTDTYMRHLPCLYGKVCQLGAEGLTAYLYTGGFELPPQLFTDTITNDLVLVDKVIGLGEVAVADSRWIDPPVDVVANAVSQAKLGGMLSGKAGITHFHIGDGERRLMLLENLINDYNIDARYVYPTHITRSERLMRDAIALARRGSYVDMDTVEENLADCLQFYRENGGPMDQLTASSDSHTPGGSPNKHFEQFISCVRDHKLPITHVLPLFTSNPADALSLKQKGRLDAGLDADVLVLDSEDYHIRHLFARGRCIIRDGERIVESEQERGLEESKA